MYVRQTNPAIKLHACFQRVLTMFTCVLRTAMPATAQAWHLHREKTQLVTDSARCSDIGLALLHNLLKGKSWESGLGVC